MLSNKAWSLDVVVSINPVKQIVSAIGGDVFLIIKPNQSEHDYQLKKNDIAALIKADLVFFIDDSLEKNFPKLIKKFSLEKKSYQLSQVSGIKLLESRFDRKKIDPHLWLDAENAVKIAEFVAQKFCEIDQENCSYYRNNFKKFRQEILKTAKLIKSDLASFKTAYATYHDAYQYFEKYFGIEAQKIISTNHFEQLKASNLKGLESVKCLFGERFDERNAAQKLAKNYHLKFIQLDGIGEEESYTNLLTNLSKKIIDCGR